MYFSKSDIQKYWREFDGNTVTNGSQLKDPIKRR